MTSRSIWGNAIVRETKELKCEPLVIVVVLFFVFLFVYVRGMSCVSKPNCLSRIIVAYFPCLGQS